MQDFEPTLEVIEDYGKKPSQEKQETIKIVILGLVALSLIYMACFHIYSSVSDQIPGAKDLVKVF